MSQVSVILNLQRVSPLEIKKVLTLIMHVTCVDSLAMWHLAQCLLWVKYCYMLE
jgi:hypothetical protein